METGHDDKICTSSDSNAHQIGNCECRLQEKKITDIFKLEKVPIQFGLLIQRKENQ